VGDAPFVIYARESIDVSQAVDEVIRAAIVFLTKAMRFRIGLDIRDLRIRFIEVDRDMSTKMLSLREIGPDRRREGFNKSFDGAFKLPLLL